MYDKKMHFWRDYKDLENDFSEILETIPLLEEHLLCPWSPKFRELMGRIYGAYEDLFKTMTKYSEYRVAKQNVKRKRIDIHFYRDLFDPIHRLSSKRVAAKEGDLGEIQPFIGFVENVDLVPAWWTAMNRVRHRWFENKKLANLKNTLEAIAGLFLLNVINKPARVELVRVGVISCEDRVSFIEGMWNRILLDLQHGYSHWKFKAETQLFLLSFPGNIELKDYFGL